jgi:branched-chain amino acid transport system permease protein
VLLGAPTLRLRGDYLAIVTLGFGEIIRVFLNNLDHPVNITNGPKGISQIDGMSFLGLDFAKKLTIGGFEFASVTLYYYLFLSLVVVSVVICHRLELVARGPCLDGHSRGRDRSQGHGHQHPQSEVAGFRYGRYLWRVFRAPCLHAFQGFISPESFSLMESVMIVAMVVLGGVGHLPGVILGAVLLSALPGGVALCGWPLAGHDGRSSGCVHPAPVVDCIGHDQRHAIASAWPVAIA